MSKTRKAARMKGKKGRQVASGPGKVKSTKKTAAAPPRKAPKPPRLPVPRPPVVPAVPAPTIPAPARTTSTEHAAKPHSLDSHTSEPMAGAGKEQSQILPPPGPAPVVEEPEQIETR